MRASGFSSRGGRLPAPDSNSTALASGHNPTAQQLGSKSAPGLSRAAADTRQRARMAARQSATFRQAFTCLALVAVASSLQASPLPLQDSAETAAQLLPEGQKILAKSNSPPAPSGINDPSTDYSQVCKKGDASCYDHTNNRGLGNMTVARAFPPVVKGPYNYAEALHKSYIFYDTQRSGKLSFQVGQEAPTSSIFDTLHCNAACCMTLCTVKIAIAAGQVQPKLVRPLPDSDLRVGAEAGLEGRLLPGLQRP